jgi:hypothetical protein
MVDSNPAFPSMEDTHARYLPSCISQCSVGRRTAGGSFVHLLHPAMHSASCHKHIASSGCPDEHTSPTHQAVACQHKCVCSRTFAERHTEMMTYIQTFINSKPRCYRLSQDSAFSSTDIRRVHLSAVISVHSFPLTVQLD